MKIFQVVGHDNQHTAIIADDSGRYEIARLFCGLYEFRIIRDDDAAKYDLGAMDDFGNFYSLSDSAFQATQITFAN
jgi:hypothetical protein